MSCTQFSLLFGVVENVHRYRHHSKILCNKIFSRENLNESNSKLFKKFLSAIIIVEAKK